MNTKTPDSDKNKTPLLIRSDQWTAAEKTKNQVSAVCLKNKQDDMIVQMNQQIVQQNQKIEQLNQKIDSQNKLIDQQNRKIDQQNKKIDDLNNLLNLQNNINAKTQNRIEIQDKNKQNSNTGKTVNIQPVPNETVKSPFSSSQTNILMADPNWGADATVFGSNFKRSNISAIYVKNTLENVPSSAWDVSALKNSSIMAWIQMASDKIHHILYLAANGEIYANPDSSYLFAYYSKLSVTDFTHLKTDLVTNMAHMFWLCQYLQTLAVSHWDVSSVTNMKDMFRNCKQLESLDISNWNISKKANTTNMFYGCKCLNQKNH